MPEQSVEMLLASIWNRREVGIKLPTDVDVMRPISHDEVEYICNYYYPYLQIINVAGTLDPDVIPTFNVLSNGWVIYDYTEAMCVSFSSKQYFKRNRDEGKGGEGGAEGGEGGGGTIIKQQFDAAYAMIKEAQIKGWASVEVITGTKLMQFYAWIAAQELGVSLYGFVPTSQQNKQYQRIAKERAKERMEKGTVPEAPAPE